MTDLAIILVTVMSSQKISFASTQGHKLAGLLDTPTNMPAHNYVVFAHCFTCGKNLAAMYHISNALTSSGFGVLRFDFTGLGESEGAFEETSFTLNVSDLVSAAGYLAAEYAAPSLLIGHSLGGAAVLAAASDIDSIKAIATIGTPFAPGYVQHLFEAAGQELEQTGRAKVNIGDRPFTIGKQFVDDLKSQRPEETIKRLKRALLIMHSPQDEIVSVNNAASIYQAAKHPKSFISLDGADHLLSRPEDARYAGTTIAAWASRYVDMPKQQDLHTDKQVVVRLDGKDGLLSYIQAGNHRLIADEPASVGGTDYGPTPYGYLLAGLGACTAMTLQMYARRKRWDLQAVEVHLSHDKIHAKDCDCDLEGDSRGYLDKINRLIEVHGELDAEQKDRLVEIANLCPVHKTLESEVLVTTGLLNV